MAVFLDEVDGVGETRLLHAMLLLPESPVDDRRGQIVHAFPFHDEIEDDCDDGAGEDGGGED